MARKKTAQTLDMLRLEPEQIDEVFGELDGTEDDQFADKREHARQPYRADVVLICEVRESRTEWGRYQVRCVDLSEGGVGFIHGAFLHLGTVCKLTLVNRQRRGFRVRGEVKRCELVQGHVHRIGVQFETPLDLYEMLGEQAA